MLKITKPNGVSIYLPPLSIVSIEEAGASSRWHGIHAYVKLSNGETVECRETAHKISSDLGKLMLTDEEAKS